jgi:hypothetical protein
MAPPNPSVASLLGKHIWRGHQVLEGHGREPTGHAQLDAVLPAGGWPEHALIELLLPADGVGELALLLPTIARLTTADRPVALVGAPYIPYAPAWQRCGVELRHLHVIDAREKQAAWAFEQILRSAACGAVIAWPGAMQTPGLRRLQLAALEGRSMGFIVRDARSADNASPAALRIEVRADRQLLVRKCRGGMPAPLPVPLSALH